MPWTEPLADPDELQRCIPGLVALSTLFAAWRNYDMRQIGDSIVAALITMLAAGFVFMALPGPDRVIELARSDPKLNPADLGNVRAILQRENGTLSSEQEFVVANVSGGRNLHVAAAPIGLDGDAVLAAGSSRGSFPTRTEKLLLNTEANQAAITFQQWLGDADKRRFTTLVQRSTDFVGIASLGGYIQYVHPAGPQSRGLATFDVATSSA